MCATGRIVQDPHRPAPLDTRDPPLQACARGFGQIERVYHPDRLKHPLRRTGPRGSGEFERISWDEALDKVARQMLRVRDTYGNRRDPRLLAHRQPIDLARPGAAQRFLNMFGGCTELWWNMSSEAEIFAVA